MCVIFVVWPSKMVSIMQQQQGELAKVKNAMTTESYLIDFGI